MFDMISCYVSGDKIEVNGQTFLLGELSEDILNISRDEFLKMGALCEKLEELRNSHIQRRAFLRFAWRRGFCDRCL